MCLSGRIVFPLLLLAGPVATVGIAFIASSYLQKKTIPFLEKHLKNFAVKVADYGDTREDRISQLPDDVLSDIISRLYFTEAVRTKILSRRWKDIGQNRSELILDCCKVFGEVQHHGHRHKSRFLKAVYQFLELHSGQKILSFGITCCLGKEVTSDVNKWMQYILKLGIKRLSLNFCSPSCVDKSGSYSPPGPLSFQLLVNAASLESLHLGNCVLQPSFYAGHIKSLRHISLESVPLDNEELRSIFWSCVNLQVMSLKHCKLPSLVVIYELQKELKGMRIEACSGVEEIYILHKNLNYYYCYTDYMIKHEFRCLPKFEELRININGRGTVPYFFGEVEMKNTQLKQLIFQTRTDELYMPAKVNMLSNLWRLCLLMMVDSKADLRSVVSILDACPLLEQLRLLARCPRYNDHRGGPWLAGHHAHLKQVEYEGFQGTRHEIEFVACLLQMASALDRLKISSSYCTYSSDFEQSEYVDLSMEDGERQLIYEQLVGQALSSKVEVIIL